jgi:hypothetical protein
MTQINTVESYPADEIIEVAAHAAATEAARRGYPPSIAIRIVADVLVLSPFWETGDAAEDTALDMVVDAMREAGR